MQKIGLGDKVRDKLSGFVGIATSRTEWLYNCVRISVAPTCLDKDNKVQDHVVFDEAQLEIVTPGEMCYKEPVYDEDDDTTIINPDRLVSTGGDRPDPQRARDITR